MIAAMPWFEQSIDRLSMPLRSEQAPFFGIPELASEPYSADRQQQMTQLADTHADNAFAHFALGWLARRGGDLQLAERAYRRALQIWPNDDRVLNNLGNALAMQGRSDEALVMYQRAYTDDPHNAAAYFNASQIFTQRFEYKAANEALQRASALNFDLVKAYQAQATEDGLLPLVDQWLAPRTFWAAMPTVRSSPLGAALLPPGWRSKWRPPAGCSDCSSCCSRSVPWCSVAACTTICRCAPAAIAAVSCVAAARNAGARSRCAPPVRRSSCRRRAWNSRASC